MPPKGRQRYHCKQCGGHRDEVGHLSRRGLCIPCAAHNMITYGEQVSTQGTPEWNKSVEAMVRRWRRDGVETLPLW